MAGFWDDKIAVRRSVTYLIRSERAFGTMTRSFVLPKSVDGAQCEASYSHGVLTVRLPKREEAKPRSIEVKVHS